MTSVDTLSLFPAEEAGPVIPAQPRRVGDPELAGLSPGRRRTVRRLQLIARGIHPITGLALHPEAPADASRKDLYLREFTCGACCHRFIDGGHAKSYPKCDLRVTHSEATDVPGWLPACLAYQPKGSPETA